MTTREFGAIELPEIQGEPNGKISQALQNQMQPPKRTRDEVLIMLGRSEILLEHAKNHLTVLINERQGFQAELAAYDNEKEKLT